jgi:hypothetical protein
MIPVLLDLITIFCLVGGCVLLWLSLRPRRRDIIITRAAELDDPFEAWDDPDRLNRGIFRRD